MCKHQCVFYGRKGGLKRGSTGSHWFDESGLEVKGEDTWVQEGVPLPSMASMVVCVARGRAYNQNVQALSHRSRMGRQNHVYLHHSRQDCHLECNASLKILPLSNYGHINPCSNLIFILEQSSNLRVSFLNLIIFISEMGVVRPAV